VLTRLRRKALLTLFAALGATLAVSHAAPAADYPSRTVNIVVAFPPGGPSDVLARLVGRRLNEIMHQPFIVENRPGSGGNIAAEQVAHAAPDGYTLLMANNSILATNAALYKSLAYDPEKDFLPITLIGTQANILVVNNEVPVHSMAELIALCKANPGKLNFASSGYGAAAHLAGELFKTEAKVDIVHIPYKGAAPALQGVMAGNVQIMFATSASVVPLIKAGKVRALAVTTPKRTALLPDLPTVAELGIRGFDATTWHGLVAPADTPKDIIEALSFATIEALKDPDTQKTMTNLGVDIVASPPKEFEAYIKSEIPKWTALVKQSGAQVD
jgi:tripartite-type tricarboxylate transporter receptor subunit TctC